MNERSRFQSLRQVPHVPNRLRYSAELRKALTISAFRKSPLNWISLATQKLYPAKLLSGGPLGFLRQVTEVLHLHEATRQLARLECRVLGNSQQRTRPRAFIRRRRRAADSLRYTKTTSMSKALPVLKR